MYGQASPRWPTSIALGLIVVFFGVYLNSDLYLASPVTDWPGESNDFVDMKSAQPDRFLGYTTDPTHGAAMCMVKNHEETVTCQEKAAKEDFAEITDKNCSKRFSSTKCFVEILCGICKDANVEVSLKKTRETLEKEMKEKCKQWESKAPKVPSACPGGGQRSGGASDSSNTGLIIVVIIVGIIVVVLGLIYYWYFVKQPRIQKKNVVRPQCNEQQTIDTDSEERNQVESLSEAEKLTTEIEKTSRLDRVTPTTGLSLQSFPLTTDQTSLCSTKSTIQSPRPPRHQPYLTLTESTYSTISSISSDPTGTTSIFMFSPSVPSPSGLESNMKTEKESGEDKARAASVGGATSAEGTASTGPVKVKSTKSLKGGKSKKSAKSSKGGKSAKK